MATIINIFKTLLKNWILIFFIVLFISKYSIYLTITVYHIVFSMYWIQWLIPIPTEIISMIVLWIIFALIYKKI